MKILVCGGRSYSDSAKVRLALDSLYAEHQFTHLIHGHARGADTLADMWARAGGVQNVVCPANWGVYGNSAGPKRNRLMADLGPDLVVAFPGGAGTNSMISIAKERGIEVVEVK